MIRVYADFQNADSEGRIRLNTNGTLRDLHLLQVQFRDGMPVTLYCNDDVNESGDDTELVAQGIINFSPTENCWVASIDWSSVQSKLVFKPGKEKLNGTGNGHLQSSPLRAKIA